MIKVSEAGSPSVRGRAPKQKKVRKVRPERTVNYEKIIKTADRFKPRYMNMTLLLAVLGMAVFGLMMVYSASWYNSQIYHGTKYYYLTSQLIGFVLGLVAIAGTYLIDYRIYKKWFWAFFVGGAILLILVFVPGIGISRLGANRWIGVGGFSMQPSEIAKFAFIVFAAAVASGATIKFRKREASSKLFSSSRKTEPAKSVLNSRPAQDFETLSHSSSKSLDTAPLSTSKNLNATRMELERPDTAPQMLSIKKVLIILAAGGTFCGLILLEPNLSITLCLGMTMFIMLFLCGARLKHLAVMMAPVLVALPVMLVAEPYRVRRLLAFIDPWARPKDEGFQLIQSLFGLGNGGFFGVGYGNSTQKHMFLPFAESDFIFSIIGEEFGFVGCVLFIAVLGLIVTQIFRVGMRCKDYFGKYLCFGIATLIFVQSAVNLAVVTGSIPPTGVPLPFISFGGTSLAVYMAAIGVVLNVDKRNKIEAQRPIS